jgi:hypothetical protein
MSSESNLLCHLESHTHHIVNFGDAEMPETPFEFAQPKR